MRGNLAKNVFYKSSLTIPSYAFTLCKSSAWIFVVVVFVPEPISMFVQRELVGQQTGEGGAQDSSPDGGLRNSASIQVYVMRTSEQKSKTMIRYKYTNFKYVIVKRLYHSKLISLPSII